MAHPGHAALVEYLPAAAAEALRLAFAVPGGSWDVPADAGAFHVPAALPERTVAGNVETARHLDAAFAAVDYPDFNYAIPFPDDLAPAQRALAELLAYRDGLVMFRWAIPATGWCRRRWLGRVDEGALERRVEFEDGPRKRVPLWRALVLLQQEGDDRPRAMLSGQPLAVRLEVFGDVALAAYRLDVHQLAWGELGEIGAEHGAWASTLADRIVALYASPQLQVERGFGVLPDEVRWPLFVALARAGGSIEPRWDGLLPASGETPERVAATLECVAALPEERRTLALLAALARQADLPAVQTALALLPGLPSASAEIARFVLDRSSQLEGMPRTEILSRLEEGGVQPVVVQPKAKKPAAARKKPAAAVATKKPAAAVATKKPAAAVAKQKPAAPAAKKKPAAAAAAKKKPAAPVAAKKKPAAPVAAKKPAPRKPARR